MTAKRIDWLDAARGIGIILVVMGHVGRGLVAAGMAQGGFWPAMDFAFYAFHMPLFFWLSGMQVPGSIDRHGRRAFTIQKLHLIAYPYFLWSLVQGGIQLLLSASTNSQVSPRDLLALAWQPLGQFWFLHALMAFQLCALLFDRRGWVALGFAALLWGGAQIWGTSMPYALLNIAAFMIYFALGYWKGEWVVSYFQEKGRRWAVLLAFTGAFLLSLGEPWGMGVEDPRALAVFPASVIGVGFVLALARQLGGLGLRLLAMLGQCSMSIFVMHILAASGVRIIALKMGWGASAGLIFAAASFVGVAAPVLMHLLGARLGLLPWLGLAPVIRNKPV